MMEEKVNPKGEIATIRTFFQFRQAKSALFYKEENDCHDHSHGLSDNGRPCSAGHSPVQGPHENIVQSNIRCKAESHGYHGNRCPAHIADKWDEAGCQKLKNSAQRDYLGIHDTEREHIASRTQQMKNRLGKSK